MKLSTGLCLVLLTGQAVGCAPPAPPSFQFDVRVESDADVPLAGVALLRGGGDTPATRTIDAQVRTPGGSAQIVVEGDRARLVVRGLPDPGRGRVYEVWLRNGTGAPRPTASLFSVDRTGAGETSVPGGVGAGDQVLVTSEPACVSTSPSRVPLVVAAV